MNDIKQKIIKNTNVEDVSYLLELGEFNCELLGISRGTFDVIGTVEIGILNFQILTKNRQIVLHDFEKVWAFFDGKKWYGVFPISEFFDS